MKDSSVFTNSPKVVLYNELQTPKHDFSPTFLPPPKGKQNLTVMDAGMFPARGLQAKEWAGSRLNLPFPLGYLLSLQTPSHLTLFLRVSSLPGSAFVVATGLQWGAGKFQSATGKLGLDPTLMLQGTLLMFPPPFREQGSIQNGGNHPGFHIIIFFKAQLTLRLTFPAMSSEDTRRPLLPSPKLLDRPSQLLILGGRLCDLMLGKPFVAPVGCHCLRRKKATGHITTKPV